MRTLIVSADRTDVHGGACNLGDAFLTDALASALGSRGHEVTIYDFGSARTTSDLPRVSGGRIRGLAAAIRSHDAVVIGGGTMFQDNEPQLLFGGLPRLCVTVATLARLNRTPHRFYGVGLDTIDRSAARWQLNAATAGVPVTLRDPDSCRRFMTYFKRPAILGADAALLASGTTPATAGHRSGAIVALNRTDAAHLTPKDVAVAQERYGRVTFLSMDQQESTADWRSLDDATRSALDHEPRVIGWRDAYQSIATAEVVVSSRMHALYMAAMAGTPMSAIGRLDKVVSFCDEFAVPRFDAVSEACVGEPAPADPRALSDATARADAALHDLLETL